MSLRAAKVKSALATSAPYVCIGFAFGYAYHKLNRSRAIEVESNATKPQIMNTVDVNTGKQLVISAVELGTLVSAALQDLASLKPLQIPSGHSKPHASVSTLDVAIVPVVSNTSTIFPSNWRDYLLQILLMPQVQQLLTTITHINVFSDEFAAAASTALDGNIAALGALKQLKYWYNFNCTQFILTLRNLCRATQFNTASSVLDQLAQLSLLDRSFKLRELVISNKVNSLTNNLDTLEKIDAHSIYPTSVYRRSKGLCLSSRDESLMECVMSTTISTSIVIETDVLSVKNHRLRDIYAPYGRCVMIIDDKVNNLYKDRFGVYFGSLGIDLVTLSFSGNEADKHIKSVEDILASLKKHSVHRNEPVLVVGGGVITDLAGFATSLYHRNTPYIMLCTSIVSGIDAGPSPRTCCDGFGYKNLYGCYHPPILTITDRTFFKTLRVGWIRHGIAEIIKMAVVKDLKLFELLERQGMKLVYSKFGTDKFDQNNADDINQIDQIIKKAMRGYVESEYGNLWETHQCRPHAYGHTWSPGFELASGMLHGHAVACGMGFGAYLAKEYGYINNKQLYRVLSLISMFELSLWHDAMNNYELIWKAQTRMVEKRGGNLCAPVPKGEIGQCGYINDLSKEDLILYLNNYKELVCNGEFDRNGFGVEAHCIEVGLECPSKVETMENKYEKEIERLTKENEYLKKELECVHGCKH